MRRVRRNRRPQAGFTLLELLLALAIIGFLTSMIFGFLSQTATTKRRIEAAQDRVHTARVALMRIAREVEMAFIADEGQSSISDRRTMFVGTSRPDVDELQFSYMGKQRLRADSPESDTAIVKYYAERDPEDRSKVNLMRRETRRLQLKDPASIPGETYILCPNVARLKFAFYDFEKREWREEWNTRSADGRDYVPSHVRIYLTVFDERGQEVTYTTSARIHLTEKVAYQPGPV